MKTFSEFTASTGASKGVLSDRLKWLQSVDCLRQREIPGGKRLEYRLTPKSLDLYHTALMALHFEQTFFPDKEKASPRLIHQRCGQAFTPRLQCGACQGDIGVWEVDYQPGPGATQDLRDKKVRRRSSIPVAQVPSARAYYRKLINLVGDRWTANLIALAFHGYTRFEQFHAELPVATNILSGRLKFLVSEGIFEQSLYLESPRRFEYRLSRKGEGTYPFFLTLLQWGDRWCDPMRAGKPMELLHKRCGKTLFAVAVCSECEGTLRPREVEFRWPG